MAYTFSGNANSSSNSLTISVTLSVGPVLSPFVVVAAIAQNASIATDTLTVGTIPLHLDVVESGGTVGIYSGPVIGLSGNQTVTITDASGFAFTTVAFALWYMQSGMIKNHTGSGTTVSSFTIPVNASEYMFACGESGSAFDFNNSTVAPAENVTVPGVGNTIAADWTIATTNGSFSVAAAHNIVGVAVTYIPPPAQAFGVIGIGSSEW